MPPSLGGPFQYEVSDAPIFSASEPRTTRRRRDGLRERSKASASSAQESAPQRRMPLTSSCTLWFAKTPSDDAEADGNRCNATSTRQVLGNSGRRCFADNRF